MPNIYLIGMMGSGKSVTAKKLAAKMGYTSADLDDLIYEHLGRTIADIFSKEGEAFFRDKEAFLLKEVSKEDLRVVATGGGTILRPANVDLMRATGKVVFLDATPGVLWDRVRDKKDRPLLQGARPQEKLLEIYATRRPLYEGACSLKVNTDGKTATLVADEIFELLRASV